MIGAAPKRAFTWLIGLLLFHLLLLSVQVRTADDQLLLRAFGLTLTTPFAMGIQFVTSSVSGFLERYAFLRGTEEENARLREENERLRLRLHQLQNMAALLPRSADYQALQQRLQFETVVADVVGRSAPFFENRLWVNAGTGSGVAYDSAVLTPRGIVGRVISAGPFSSEVELITNRQAAAGARLQESRLEGVVEGAGEAWLTLSYIPITQPVQVGELVVTSGSDRVYPEEIPIGTVISAQQDSPIYQTIRVRPAIELSRLEEVLVVVGRKVEPAPPADSPVQSARSPGSEARPD